MVQRERGLEARYIDPWLTVLWSILKCVKLLFHPSLYLHTLNLDIKVMHFLLIVVTTALPHSTASSLV
jgi:hypothetical protein